MVMPPRLGWLMVAFYFVACVNCWMLAGKIRPTDTVAVQERWIWRSISILFFAFAITRQLGLGAALTQAGRIIAKNEHWYGRREDFQLVFIAGVALLCLATARALLIWARKTHLSTSLAVVGTTLVAGFALVRAASLHHVDQFLAERFLILSLNSILEAGVTGLVIIASIWRGWLLHLNKRNR
jgi:hypothetical protein